MKAYRYAAGILLLFLLIGGCARKETEKEADRLLARALLLEDHPDSLSQAIDLYRQGGRRHAGIPQGKRAGERAEVLARVKEIYDRTPRTVEADTVVVRVCKEVLAAAPDYRPAIRRLGAIYHGQIDFLAQFTVSPLGRDEAMMKRARDLWREQDGIWSRYDFRAQHEDREWGDRLCRSSQVVANMLHTYGRYPEALAAVERGISYAGTDATAAQGRGYAAYLNFWVKNFAKTTQLAQEALDSGLLEKADRAKAYHAQGMGYAYLYLDSKKPEDLDRSIRALNESLRIEPNNPSARELLRAMRDAKVKLAAAASP